MQNIEVETRGAVAILRLSRPPVNALSSAMMRELIDALQQVDASDTLRVAILTGAGKCFSAGVDLKEQLQALDSGEPGPVDQGPAMYQALLHGKKPLIAAINGPALGAGLGIAASCNILLASETAEVGLPEINVGALGGARHAMRLLGHSTVNRMLLTGHRLSAAELAQRHVVEAVLPAAELLPRAMALAEEIAAKDPLAVEHARQCLAQIETLPVLDGYVYESGHSQALGQTTNARALMAGFLSGRR